MVRLGRGEFMVAVVDGRRRWRLVYVRYRLYYSYVSVRRIYFFRLVNGGSRSRTKKKMSDLLGIPLLKYYGYVYVKYFEGVTLLIFICRGMFT